MLVNISDAFPRDTLISRPQILKNPHDIYPDTGGIRDIPRRQTQAQRPSLRELFQRSGKQARLIHQAYRQYGYRLAEIADYLGVHAATVSRRLKQAEQAHA